MDRIIRSLDVNKLRPAIRPSWESEVLDASSGVFFKTVHLEPGNLSGYYTLETNDGDVLVARWNAAGMKERAVWLWDSPMDSVLAIEMDPSIMEAVELSAYCESLLAWNEGVVGLREIRLGYAPTVGTSVRVVGDGPHASNSARGGLIWWLAADGNRERAILIISMAKRFSSDDYPLGSYSVPERFPPLRDRLRALGREKLITELERVAYDYVRWAPLERNEIILRELLTRDPLNDWELKRVLLGPVTRSPGDSEFVGGRMLAFVNAASALNQVGVYANSIVRLFLGPGTPRTYEIYVIGHLFRVAEQNNVDLTEGAFELAEKGMFVHASLHYLGHHLEDEGALRRLLELRVAPGDESDKEYAIGKIRERLKIR
jgi:hypothetical protein